MIDYLIEHKNSDNESLRSADSQYSNSLLGLSLLYENGEEANAKGAKNNKQYIFWFKRQSLITNTFRAF